MARFGDVRRRIILLFVLGIGLPSSLLGYLALRGVRNDQALEEQTQRTKLSEMASVAVSVYDSCLIAVGRSLDSALSQADRQPESPPRPRADLAAPTLVARHPLTEGIFHLSEEGTVDEVLAPDMLFRSQSDAGTGQPALTDQVLAQLEAARRLEFRDTDPAAALGAYQVIASGSFDARARAEALGAMARIRRDQGEFDAASALYRQLASQFDQVPTTGGIPFDLAARLELGRTQAMAGRNIDAAHTLVDLYTRLVRTERGLSRAQFGSFSTNLRESLDEILENGGDDQELATLSQTVERLAQEAESNRAGADRILTFQASAGEALASRGDHGSRVGESKYVRSSVEVGGHSFYLLTEDSPPPGLEDPVGTWGALLHPDSLESLLVTILRGQAESEGVVWAIRGPTGDVLASSEEPASPGGPRLSEELASPGKPTSSETLTSSPRVSDRPGPPVDGVVSVRENLPGGIPPYTIELSRSDGGFVRTLFTSRRGVYFYGFLLLAGILAFGLTLTVVTVSHQLALARMQSDFVSTVSHEFKSPLTAIRQIAEMLHSGKASSEERRQRYYDLLLEQSERLSLLIDRVLDFARMESGRQTFRIHPVAVGEFLEDVVEQAQQRFGPTGFDLQSEIPPELPTVPIDADALHQAVTNLIDNAVKYSGSSRRVVIRGSLDGGNVAISVQDFGIGLDPKEKARVFERFYRGGDALTRSVKGTGLGLTLVKQIVHGHGGEVTVESEPGHGSTFTIRIPLERAAQ